MVDTYFFLPNEKASRLSQHYVETEKGVVPISAVNKSGFEKFPIEGAKSYFSGGGGLCSTTSDYANFLQMVLNDGTLNGKRVISKATIQKMKTNQLADDIPVFGNPNSGYTYGFSYQKIATNSGYHYKKGRLGWSGLFGTRYWLNPEQNMSVVIMTQTYPQPSRDKIFKEFEGLVNSSFK